MLTSPLAAFHPANALTYGSLVSGVAAIVAAVHGLAGVSGALIALSVVADTFDGRFAGLFNRTPLERAVGVQLDSLSDAIVFAAAPCVCMALLAPDGTWFVELGTWIAFCAFAICAITRLAFYNATRETANEFVGLPVPAAALAWSSILLVSPGMLLSTVILASAAVAMVAPVRIPRPTGLGLAAFVAWPLTVIAAHLASL
jgi:CDP-diacylglycerol--serine O-phosphatidyltransferase